MESTVTYLGTYVLQQDMRLRMPKAILSNLNVKKGISNFDIFFDSNNKEIILKVSNMTKEKPRE